MLAPLLISVSGLLHVPSAVSTRSNVINRRASKCMMAIEAPVETAMPDKLAEWGCDAALWSRIPNGAVRDMARFARDGKEGLARKRIETMKTL